MNPDETMSIPMHTTGRGGRTTGLEIVLTGAAIGLSVYTLMKLNTLEERVRSMSKDDLRTASCNISRVQFPRRDPEEEEEEETQRVPPRPSSAPPSTARENDYETSEDEESDDDEESPPPEVERIVEVVHPPARNTRRSESTKK